MNKFAVVLLMVCANSSDGWKTDIFCW